MTEEKTMHELICEGIDTDPRMTHYDKKQLAVINDAGVHKKEDRDRVLKEAGLSTYSGPRGVCSRCGACCRVIPLSISHMSPEMLAYYRCRGLKEDQGFILIPHDCQHLKGHKQFAGITTIPTCDIHDSPDRPRVCQIFKGQRRGSKHVLFYIPPGCTMRRDGA